MAIASTSCQPALADVFVSGSEHEGFGLMFLEALCCGLPIVCYDEGGQTDFLQDGATGVVVRVDDRAGLVAAVDRLVVDADAMRGFLATIANASSR